MSNGDKEYMVHIPVLPRLGGGRENEDMDHVLLIPVARANAGT